MKARPSDVQQVARALPVGDLRVVLVPLGVLHLRVLAHERLGEHVVDERVGLERLDGLEQVAREGAVAPGGPAFQS